MIAGHGLLSGSLVRKLAAIRYLPLAGRPKVFGIGLSRTGTNSLARALQRLGYRSCHFPVFMMEFRGGRLTINASAVRYYEALTDTPIAAFFRELDAHYPGSRFILTTRDRDGWLESCRRFFRDGKWPDQPGIHALHDRLYGGSRFDPDRFANAYETHLADVRTYFRHRRKDLLELSITAGEGYEKLCPFLGKPVLQESFPQTHAAASFIAPS